MTGRKKSCARCDYEVIEDDLYCSSCGDQLFEFRVEPPDITFYVDPNASGVIRRLLTVTDGGWGHPTVECVGLPPWLQFDSEQQAFLLDTAQLEVLDVSRTIGMQVRDTDTGQQIQVSVTPPPEPVARPLTLPAGHAFGTSAALEIEVWSPAIMESLTFWPPYLEWTSAAPCKLSLGINTIPLMAKAPSDQQSGEAVLSFSMKIRGMEEPLAGEVDIHFLESPQLYIPEIDDQHEPPVLNFGEGEFHLTCENRGRGAALQVDELTLVPRPGDDPPPPIVFSRYPSRASIDKLNSVQFSIRAEAMGPVAKGHYWYDVVIRSNDPDAGSRPRPLSIEVTEDWCHGHVALDYGTIDSTIAFYDDRQGAVNLPLEDARDDPKIYSNVFFSNCLDGQDPPFEWEIGSRALALGRSNRGQLVTAAKIRVGKSHKETLRFASLGRVVDLESEEVVAYAMRTLLLRTRVKLKQRLVHIALCVPTRFTLRRKELLRQALSDAARRLSMEVTVKLLDESLAAGVFSLLSGPATERKAESIIMVVDFGGGTTDVTVFRVKRGAKSGPLAVDIIGAWGDPELGGESITQILARDLLARLVGKPDASPLALLQIAPDAERLKVAVSELEEARRRAKKPDPIDVIEALSPAARGRLGRLCTARGAGAQEDLLECVYGYLEKGVLPVRCLSFDSSGAKMVDFPVEGVIGVFAEKLENLKTSLKSLLRKISEAERIDLQKVDTVLLAGQSSRFPTVREQLLDIGADVTFVKDAGGNPLLKECVSQGALMLVGELLKIQGENRLWARLGYVPGVRFKELIEWGSPYPGQSEEIVLGPDSVRQGKLEVEIKENLTLDLERPTARFGVFSLDVGDAPGPYYFRLHLDREAGVLGKCRLEGETEERLMEYVP
ncbi:MAG: Hsp70 family protein [Bryobacteraceae bacterium]|jgi:hypothetical protein